MYCGRQLIKVSYIAGTKCLPGWVCDCLIRNFQTGDAFHEYEQAIIATIVRGREWGADIQHPIFLDEFPDPPSLRAVARAAQWLINSIREPAEPSNLAKSPMAAYLHAEELRKALDAVPKWILEE